MGPLWHLCICACGCAPAYVITQKAHMTGLTLDPPFPLRIQELSGETLLGLIPAHSREGTLLVSVPQTPHVSEADLELLNLLPSPPYC